MIKQAILIIAHNNFGTLEKIIECLDSDYFDLYVHIDLKSKNFNLEELSKIPKKSKIYIYNKYNVRWADFSQVECELFLLKQAVSNGIYTYFHLISGVDMPLKSPKAIYDFFEKNKGKEFVHFHTSEFPNYKYDWIKYYWVFRKFSRKSKILYVLEYISIKIQKLFHINRIKNLEIKFMTGANWFSITNDFVEYLLSQEDKFKKIFNHTRSADEIFMQTVLYNSKFKKDLYYSKFDDNYISCMRFIDWNRGNPYVFKITDYDDLVNSKYLFARKFDENVDKEIISKLYENCLNRKLGEENEKSSTKSISK